MKKVKKYNDIEFWAEGGVVYIFNTKEAENYVPGETPVEQISKHFRGLPPKTFLKRAIAAAVLNRATWFGYPSEEKKIYTFLEDARQVYKTAVAQGAVDDPKADVQRKKERAQKPYLWIPPTVSKQVTPKPIENILLQGYEDE